MHETHSRLAGDKPVIPEILWPRQERKAITRLAEAEPLTYWANKARRFIELAEPKEIEFFVSRMRDSAATRYDTELICEIRKHALEAGMLKQTPGLQSVYAGRIFAAAGMTRMFREMTQSSGLYGYIGAKEAWNISAGFVPMMSWPRITHRFDAKAWELVTTKPIELMPQDAVGLFDRFVNRTLMLEIPPGTLGDVRWLCGSIHRLTETRVAVNISGFPTPVEAFEPVESNIYYLFHDFGDGIDPSTWGNWEPGVGGKEVFYAFLSAAAYLNSRPDDIEATKAPGVRVRRLANKAKTELPVTNIVGSRLGRTIRLLEEKRDAVEAENRTITGRKKPVPHWRSPHHAVYWTGTGRKVPVVRWIDAVLVNENVAGAPVTTHKVTT